MRLSLILASVVTALSLFHAAPADAFYGGPGKQVPVDKSVTGIYGYYEYLPLDYSETSGKKFPLVLFFHGAGESGDGKINGTLSKVLANEPPKFLKDGSKHLPAVVISPQGGFWYGHVNRLLDFILKTYPAIDPERVYVTGLSMGGGEVVDILNGMPGRIAAAAPIASNWAAGSLTLSPALDNMPFWSFHAYDDRTTWYMNSIELAQKISKSANKFETGYVKNAGDGMLVYSYATGKHTWTMGANTTKQIDVDSRVRVTMYATGGHNSWSRAYRNDDFWKWLLSWKRGGILIGSETPPTVPPTTPPTTPPVTPPVTPPPTPPAATTGQLQVDFGSGTVAMPAGWNNGGLNSAKEIMLKDSKGVATNVRLARVTGPRGVNNGGTKTPAASLGLPVVATDDSFFGNTGLHGGVAVPVMSFELRGLDPSKSYGFQFFASRINVKDIRSTKYTMTNGTQSVVATLNASNNTDRVAVINGIKPGADGVLRLNVTRGDDNNEPTGYFYIGSMIVKY